MGNWWHRIGAVLGSALAILPVLGMIPGTSALVHVATTVVGVGITLATSLEKAMGRGE